MKALHTDHPSAEQLSAFVNGRLEPAQQRWLEEHVASCQRCCQVLEQIPNDTLLAGIHLPDTSVEGTLPRVLLSEAEVPPPLRNHPRYRLVRRLGSGGMGEVYQAEHRLLERMVALKVIHRNLMKHPQAIERFRLEWKAAGRLMHPNIVTAHDADQAGDVHFLVMEYVDGISLARLVETTGPLPAHLACDYLRQAALGLQHAFEQGMVHRDIKPQNLMVTRQGQIKILDFGLVRFGLEPESLSKQPSSGSVRQNLTAASSVLGTPDYIAPEQAQGSRTVDIRADIYSLGCTLYFLLTGQPPYANAAPPDKLVSHVFGPLPPLETVHAEMRAFLRRMLAKKVEDRFQTPAELAAALVPYLRRGASTVPPGLSSRDQQTPAASVLPTEALPARLARRRPLRAGLLALVCLPLLYAAWLLLSPGQRSGAPQPGHSGVPVKKVAQRLPVLLVLPHKFHLGDYTSIRGELTAASWPVRVASSAAECVEVDPPGPTRLQPDLLLHAGLKGADYAALVFVGGHVYEYKDDNWPARAHILGLIDDMRTLRRPVACVNTSMLILATAPVGRGKKMAYREEMAGQFPQVSWVQQPVVRDDWLLTAGSRRDIPALVRELIQGLDR